MKSHPCLIHSSLLRLIVLPHIILIACLNVSAGGYGQEVFVGALQSSDSGAKHSRPVESPAARGFLEQLPLSDPGLGEVIDTIPRLLPVQDGYWLCGGNDLYKLSLKGEILNHIVYPFSNTSPTFWGALATTSGSRFYALDCNTNAEWLPATLSLFDDNGNVLRQWMINDRIHYGIIHAAVDGLYLISDPVSNSIYIFNFDGQLLHYMDFPNNLLSALSEDTGGSLWAGTYVNGTTVNVFQLNANGQAGRAYSLQTNMDYPAPMSFRYVQDLIPLPDGGLVINVQMVSQDGHVFTFLGKIGPDGSMSWGQLYQDLNLVGLKRDMKGNLWGNAQLLDENYAIEKATLIRFSPQGEFQWALERQETTCYNLMLSDQIAVTADGSLAMAWMRQCHDTEFWFGILDPMMLLHGCDTIQPGDLGDRWMGPVETDIQPITIQPVEEPLLNIWEEPTALWPGTGDVINYCPLGVYPPVFLRAGPSVFDSSNSPSAPVQRLTGGR